MTRVLDNKSALRYKLCHSSNAGFDSEHVWVEVDDCPSTAGGYTRQVSQVVPEGGRPPTKGVLNVELADVHGVESHAGSHSNRVSGKAGQVI